MLGLFSHLWIAAQSIIAIQHGNITTFTATLDSAIIKAQSGDYIYLPGGVVPSNSSNINIKKKLRIFGAGYNVDSSASTGTTQILIAGNVQFDIGSDSSFLTGVSLTGSIQISGASNITIMRNNFSDLSLQNTSNILITENILKSINANNQIVPNLLVQKNIIYGAVAYISGGGTFSNNVFTFFQSSYPSLMYYNSNNQFQNNIFLSATNNFYSYSNCSVFYNNIFSADSTVILGCISSGNIFNQTSSNTFINYSPNSQWTTKQNFHLKAGSPGIAKGTDSKDIGIYGSSLPFKDGGIPFNPHFQSVTIGNTTDASGKLSVNITVRAQDY